VGKSLDSSVVSISDAQTVGTAEISEAVTSVELTNLQTAVPFAGIDSTILTASADSPVTTAANVAADEASDFSGSLDDSALSRFVRTDRTATALSTSLDESVQTNSTSALRIIQDKTTGTDTSITSSSETESIAGEETTISKEDAERTLVPAEELLSAETTIAQESPATSVSTSASLGALDATTSVETIPEATTGDSSSGDAFLTVAVSAEVGDAQNISRAGTTLSSSLDESSRSSTNSDTEKLEVGEDITTALDIPNRALVVVISVLGEAFTRAVTTATRTTSVGSPPQSDEQALTVEMPAQTDAQTVVEPSVSKAIATDGAVVTDADTLSRFAITSTVSEEAAIDASPTTTPRPGDEIASSITAASASTSGGTATLSQSTAFSIDEPANTASAGSSQGSNEVSSSLDTSVVSVSNAQTPVGLSASTATENVGITVESTGTSAFLSDANVATASTDGSVETGFGASVGDSISASSASAVGSRIATDTVLQSSLDATTSVEGVQIRASAAATSFETLNAEVLTVARDGSAESVAVTEAFDSVSASTALDEAGVVQSPAEVAQTLEFTASQTDAALTQGIGAPIRSDESSLTFDTGEQILSESEAFQAESFRIAFATGIISDAATTAAIAAEQSLSVEEPARSLFGTVALVSEEQSTATDISALTGSVTALFNSDETSSSVDSSVLSTSVSPALTSLTSSLARENAILNADVSSFSTALQDADESTASVTAASESGVDAPPFVSGEFSEAIEEPLQADSVTSVIQSDELASALDISDVSLTTPFSELGASLAQALAEGNVTVSALAIFILTVDDVFFETSSTEEGSSKVKIDDSATQTEVE
jgi:hypothetical protein